MMYNARTGETFEIGNVSRFNILTPEGQPIETIDVKHDTRSLLSLVDKGMFSDYDYMPVTTKDVAQLTALGMETSAATYGAIRMIGGVGGAVIAGMTFGAGAVAAGAGLAFMVDGLKLEAFEFVKNSLKKDSPKEFWNDFVNNVNEIKNEDSGFMRFLEGAGIGSSYFSSGASEALYDEWGDVLKKGGSYTAGNVLGTIARVTAGVAAFGGMKPDLAVGQGWANTSSGLIADMSIADGLSEMGNKIGNGTEVWEAVKVGGLVGLASGVAGGATLKIFPWVARSMAPQLVTAFNNSSMVNAVSNGAENVAWYGISQSLAETFTGEDRPIDPKTMGFMFGAGFGLSYLSHKFSTKAFEDEAMAKFSPEQEAALAYRPDPSVANPVPAYLRNLPRETFFDNTAKQMNKEETVEIARALTARDRIMSKTYQSETEFVDSVNKEYANAKGVNMYRENALSVAKDYAARNGTTTSGWKMMQFINKSQMSKSDPINMSQAAKDVINENMSMLSKMGLDDAEIDAVASQAFEVAFKRTKGQVGNYEIRQSFNEVLGGLL
jgi:hypothetical protein